MCIDFIDIILGHNYLVREFPEGLRDQEPDEGEHERVRGSNDAVASAWWEAEENSRGQGKGEDGKDNEHSEIHFYIYTQN